MEHRSQEEARLILLYRQEIREIKREGHSNPGLLSLRLAIGQSLFPLLVYMPPKDRVPGFSPPPQHDPAQCFVLSKASVSTFVKF